MTVVYLVVGGPLGTVARHYAAQYAADGFGSRPLGILLVNVLGSFAIGLFLTLSQERFDWSPDVRILIAGGFLGAFTTFSALSWDTMQFLQVRDVAAASLNLAGTALLGLLAVYGGTVLARSLA